jgi:hypothetical protein
VDLIAQWTEPADSALQIVRIREIWSTIEPLTAGAAMINHLNTEDRPERIRASYNGNYDRLAAIKARYDPANLFRLNANIQPSS